MKVFNHHIYEYQKGLRSLILHTTSKSNYFEIIRRLEKLKIPYQIYSLSEKAINIFFGDEGCIEIIRKINKERLVDYSPEEDFILGTMLGYCRKQQCERYLKLINKSASAKRSAVSL
ncbi:MAG TPA: DUF2023 domain-containing protein [Lentisphaeria bacterium]|nr:MAG: hypothetical protein A2X47_08610 [Lentisphaerae bacterium GWF2_38_69]HBM15190.1 DUF2023 domain-containing protein [Lentisphaeria bacterium]